MVMLLFEVIPRGINPKKISKGVGKNPPSGHWSPEMQPCVQGQEWCSMCSAQHPWAYRKPLQHPDLCPAENMFHIISSTPQPSKTHPCPCLALIFYTGSLTMKVKVPSVFHFDVLCWVLLMTESQMRWELRFLLGKQEVGNLTPPVSSPLAKFISAPFTSKAMPGFLLCCICAGTLTRKTVLWTNPSQQPGCS